MTEKTSAKTEDQILDQTFGGFDTQMTGSGAETGAATPLPAKKKSNNNLVFIGMGVAAVAIVGYIAVLKPMLQEQPHQAPAPVAQKQVPPTPVVPVAPVVVAEVKPVEVTPPVVPVVAVSPEVKPTEAAPVVPVAPVVAAEVKPVEVTPPVASVVAVNPEVNPEVKPTEVKPIDQKSVAVVDELKGLFDKQNKEFKVILDDVGSKVSTIEKTLEKQGQINTNVDERLTALEQGKKKVVVSSNNTSEGNSNVVKKPYVKPIVRVAPKVLSNTQNNSEVLVDKSNDKVSAVSKDSKTSVLIKEVKKSPEYQPLAIHSIYSGRVWLKNEDGSLSTFQEGDKLPTGEVIKNINSDTFEVTTDKRKVSK